MSEDKQYTDDELKKLTGMTPVGQFETASQIQRQIVLAKGKLERMSVNAPLRYKVAMSQYIAKLRSKLSQKK